MLPPSASWATLLQLIMGNMTGVARERRRNLVRTHADRSHLQVKFDRHLLLQFRKILGTAHISTTRALAPGAHHMMHNSDGNRGKESLHCGRVITVYAAGAHARGIGGTDLGSRGFELLGITANDPGDAAPGVAAVRNSFGTNAQDEGLAQWGWGVYSLSTVFAAALPMPLLPPKIRTVLPINDIAGMCSRALIATAQKVCF